MAAIDKIYGNKQQMQEFRNWCEENNSEALEYFYMWNPEQLKDSQNHCITNFPKRIDEWMLNNCPIKWVTDYIKEQYGIKETKPKNSL